MIKLLRFLRLPCLRLKTWWFSWIKLPHQTFYQLFTIFLKPYQITKKVSLIGGTCFFICLNIVWESQSRLVMDEESIYLLDQIQRDIETLYEGTDPKIQRLPNYSVHVHLKKTRMNLKRLNTRLLMNSKYLDGLLWSVWPDQNKFDERYAAMARICLI